MITYGPQQKPALQAITFVPNAEEADLPQTKEKIEVIVASEEDAKNL
jgi:hypothetical protein